MLENEFQYFLDHQQEIYHIHGDKVVVIVGNRVIGVFDNEAQAITESRKEYAPGTFLVQKSGPDEKVYTAHFHSPKVTFS